MIFLYGLGLLSLVVIIHELGHFLVGRAFGVKFLSFSIGMGPRLIRLRILDTPFFISLLPLGGYVRPLALLEETIEEKNSFLNKCYRFLAPIDKEEQATLSGYDSGSFENVYNKSYFAQASIILGGVFFNLLSILIVSFSFLYLYNERSIFRDISVVETVKKKSMAEYAGFKPGDRILTVNGNMFSGWASVFKEMESTRSKQVIFVIQRDAGEGFSIHTLKLFQNANYYDADGPTVVFKNVGMAPPVDTKPYSIAEAIHGAFRVLWVHSKLIVEGFTGIRKNDSPEPLLHGAKTFGSPIVGMFEIGLIASQSMEHFVAYFSVINLIVVLFNLFPLPILDGGQFLMLTIEKVFMVPVTGKVKHAIQQFGFSFVLLLTLFLLGKDLIEAWM